MIATEGLRGATRASGFASLQAARHNGRGLEIGDVPKRLMARATGHQSPTPGHVHDLAGGGDSVFLPAAEGIHPQTHLQLLELLVVLIARRMNVFGLGDKLHLIVAADAST